MSFGRLRAFLPFAFFLGLMAPVKAESFKFLSINLASKHINASGKYNEENFGLGVGYSFDIRENLRTVLEAGFYKNSYSEQSHYAIGSVDYQFYEMKNDATLHIGAFTGFSYYGDRAKAIGGHGFWSVGKYIVIGGVEATYATSQGTEFVIGLVPAAPKADGLITFRIRQRF